MNVYLSRCAYEHIYNITNVYLCAYRSIYVLMSANTRCSNIGNIIPAKVLMMIGRCAMRVARCGLR